MITNYPWEEMEALTLWFEVKKNSYNISIELEIIICMKVLKKHFYIPTELWMWKKLVTVKGITWLFHQILLSRIKSVKWWSYETMTGPLLADLIK